MTEVYDYKAGKTYDSSTGAPRNRPLWDSPEQEMHACAVVRLNGRWRWPTDEPGLIEIEAPLHYAARVAHLAGLLPDAPEPYNCGAKGCAACARQPSSAPRQPGEDG